MLLLSSDASLAIGCFSCHRRLARLQALRGRRDVAKDGRGPRAMAEEGRGPRAVAEEAWTKRRGRRGVDEKAWSKRVVAEEGVDEEGLWPKRVSLPGIKYGN